MTNEEMRARGISNAAAENRRREATADPLRAIHDEADPLVVKLGGIGPRGVSTCAIKLCTPARAREFARRVNGGASKIDPETVPT